jgi:Carbonic anhydrases/acetyltransferases, isoleucine patch superfamily
MNVQPDSLPTGHDGIVRRLNKGPTIHSSAWVVPGATVLGDVILEEESSVWYGAVLRGDINRIVIGPRSNVQDNAVIHVDTGYPTSVGELVTIGTPRSFTHARSTRSTRRHGRNHSRRRRSRRAVHHRRKRARNNGYLKIPPGSLVLGSPAKIRRQLTLEEQTDIARWAWSYVETAKQYRGFY